MLYIEVKDFNCKKCGSKEYAVISLEHIEINSYNYGMHKFKVLDVYRNGLLTYLKLEYNGKYIGDFDCSLIYWGHIGMLIGKEVNRCKKYFIENK